VPSLFALGSGSSGSTIQGLDLYDYTANAVSLTSSTSGNWIQKNWIGFYRDPSTGKVSLNDDLGDQFNNNASGIGLQSNNNAIRSNVISGNDIGILFENSPGASPFNHGNNIAANFIGTDPSGTTAVGYRNSYAGILMGAGSNGNWIGDSNVISGNATQRIEITGGNANLIFGNRIGTDVTGNHAIPNGNGITLEFMASNNLIGLRLGSGNLISGNRNLAISIGASNPVGDANGNQLLNNIIGLNASQTAAISPGAYGISISNGSQSNLIQSNVIAGARSDGVLLSNASTNAVNHSWIGESSSGTGFANSQYGVAVTFGSNYNSILGNHFGVNNLGNIYVHTTSIGNNIEVPATGSTGATSLATIPDQIQQIFQHYALMVQALWSRNISLAYQELGNIISLYVSVELEILSSLLRM
jgi:titin